MRVEPRLRVFAGVVLWPIAVRVVLTDGSKTTWGTTLAMLCGLFLFSVARSQIPFLGKPSLFWWNVACRGDVALFAARIAPDAYFTPLVVFLAVFRLTRVSERAKELCCGGLAWRGAPLALLLCPGNQGYALDVMCVAVMLVFRVREPAQVHSALEYHKEAELRVAGDAVACYSLACAGSPLATRVVVAGATLLMASLAYVQPKNTKLDHWDQRNNSTPKHAPLPFRNV